MTTDMVLIPCFSTSSNSREYRRVESAFNGFDMNVLNIPGYSVDYGSGYKWLGDTTLNDVVATCVQECSIYTKPYILAGHSIGANIALRVFHQLRTKPTHLVLFDPVVYVPNPRLYGFRIPSFIIRAFSGIPFPVVCQLSQGLSNKTSFSMSPLMMTLFWSDMLRTGHIIDAAPVDCTITVLDDNDPWCKGYSKISTEVIYTKCSRHFSMNSPSSMLAVLSVLNKTA
jgi:hypothetical protein